MQFDLLNRGKKNETIALIAVICCVILVGYYFLFLKPVISKLFTLIPKAAKLQGDLNGAELMINNIAKLEEELRDLRVKAVSYSSRLPTEEELPSILESLSAMAQGADVKITKIVPLDRADNTKQDKGSKTTVYEEREILINAQCGYHQLGEFIAKLEEGERFMEISDINIEAVRTNMKRHNVQLTVKAFVLTDKEKAK